MIHYLLIFKNEFKKESPIEFFGSIINAMINGWHKFWESILIMREQNPYLSVALTGGTILLLGLILVIFETQRIVTRETIETHSKHEETPPEAFVVLDLFSEVLESSVGGIGVKVAELTPKIEHINEIYQHGEKHKAFARALGIATEVVLIGFFVETFGIGEIFISALSFQDNWWLLMAQSMLGVMLSTRVALFFGEKVEEAAERQYEHEVHMEARNNHKNRISRH